MADKNNLRFYRILLAVGFLFFLLGLTLLIFLPSKRAEGFFITFLFFLMVFSAILIYISLVLKKAALLYISLNMLVYFVGAIIVKINVLPIKLPKLWPVMMVSFGITLVPSCYLKSGKLKTIYLFPAAALTLLGLFFMLFSFNIIKVPLRTFIGYIWPLIFIFAGLFLIGYYLYCQSTKSVFLDESGEIDSEIQFMEKTDE